MTLKRVLISISAIVFGSLAIQFAFGQASKNTGYRLASSASL